MEDAGVANGSRSSNRGNLLNKVAALLVLVVVEKGSRSRNGKHSLNKVVLVAVFVMLANGSRSSNGEHLLNKVVALLVWWCWQAVATAATESSCSIN